ncbi:MAG: prolyl oligopeptidase family serine peptidase [Acidobacteriota bacterium]
MLDLTLRRPARTATAVLALSLLLTTSSATGQTPYQVPSADLVRIADAPRLPATRVSPDQRWLLLLQSPSLPSIAELAEEELRLAGLRFRPRLLAPSRTRPYASLELVEVATGRKASVSGLPSGALVETVSWSPDGEHLLLSAQVGAAIEAWVVEVATAKAKRLSDRRLHLVARNAPTWLPDSSGVVATVEPENWGAAPASNPVPTGPVVQESLGAKAPARTYQDLLADAHDEALFEHYFTAQICVLRLDGSIEALGKPDLVVSLDPAPDGKHLLVETLSRPFSYRVPYYRFPRTSEVWKLDGERVASVAEVPLQEGVPMAFGSVPVGPRSLQWRADADAELLWAEALDGGDAGRESELRDRLFLLAAPFDEPARPLIDLTSRFSGVRWSAEGLALIDETWWKTRRVKTWAVAPETGESKMLFDRSSEDRYSDPGRPLTRSDDRGQRVLARAANGRLWLVGQGASDDGDRPFLDELDPMTGATKRLYQSQAPFYERPLDVLSAADGSHRILLSRESPEEPPNLYLIDADGGDATQLTSFAHPTPMLQGLSKEVLRYQRNDGVQLTGTLYLPPGYEPSDGPLPMLMWAYPREFKSAAAAGQVRGSKYRFDSINYWSPLVWLSRGYAVLDNPTMPIVGEGEEEPNDTYVEQLVASASAAVEEVVRRGVTSRDRIAIGGHSYGAFMTANLLAHSDLFAAGIARSGAYNRTLTPFGFQAEERSYWEAPEVYYAMSPFMHADKVNEPILLIHGALDNNSGTFPLQSERYFAALKGHGATARLAMLPLESHGYRSRESLLHMLWEQEQWLDRYVKARESSSTDSDDR